MKKYLHLLIAVFLIGACTSSKNSISKTTEDKELLSLVKKFEKDPTNTEIKNTLVTDYDKASKIHLDKIEIYKSLTAVERWDKIIKEYAALGNLAQLISNSSAAFGVIHPSLYADELQTAKQNAAIEYYNVGISNLNIGDKSSARSAYYAFKKVVELIPGFKDVRQQMAKAYEKSVVNVVINPVRDNTFFYSSMGWNNYGNNFNNDYFQRSLVNDLGGNYNKNAPAIFFTDWEASRNNIHPDWIVDLTWINLNIPQPMANQYSRNVSRQIENGRDTSGKIYYQTVTATLYVTRKYFNASGDMELRIFDATTGRNITTNRFSDQFNWEEEYATYTGDSRALSNNEYALLHNNNYQIPRKEDILNQLSQRIYPQVKNRIATSVNW